MTMQATVQATMRLLYFPTLNGHKVAIALEEMGLAYEVEIVDILAGSQDRPEFRAINPNGRIPALVDGDVRVFESAAILQYLGRKTGLFYPADERLRTRIDSWLFWQMSGLGPMSGQVNWFTRAAAKPARDPAETGLALYRFRKETERLFGVLETALAGAEYLCDDYSIADMCVWPWIEKYPDNGGGLAGHPAIAAWHARIAARPAVARALAIGQAGLEHCTPVASAALTAKPAASAALTAKPAASAALTAKPAASVALTAKPAASAALTAKKAI